MRFILVFSVSVFVAAFQLQAQSPVYPGGVTCPYDECGTEFPDTDSNDVYRRLPVGLFVIHDDRPEYVIVGPRGQSAAAERALEAAGAVLIRRRDFRNLRQRTLVFDLRGLSLAQARRILDRAAPQTSADVHSLFRFAQGAPRLYAADLIGQSGAAGHCRLNGLRIGQIDGVVDRSHPALQGAGVISHSVLRKGERHSDTGHGTSVAALLVGQDASGALSGYAGGAQLYAVAAFGRDNRGAAADVERIGAALDWLLGHNVRLINMSFAGPVNTALDAMLDGAAARGAVLIAAAGNGGNARAVYPAASDSVIAVTAVDARLRRYRSANTGDHIEFAAPGVDLYVARGRGGGYASGTSYAAPILSGLAARLMKRGVRSGPAIRARLKGQSVDLGTPGRDSAFGWGLVKASGC